MKTGRPPKAMRVEAPRLPDRLEPGRVESDMELEGLVVSDLDLSDRNVGGSLADVRGAASLRGATISRDLVLPMVPALFADSGITLTDDNNPGHV